MYIEQFSYRVLWFRQVLSILGYADSFLTRDGVLVKQQKRLKFYIIAVYNTFKNFIFLHTKPLLVIYGCATLYPIKPYLTFEKLEADYSVCKK